MYSVHILDTSALADGSTQIGMQVPPSNVHTRIETKTCAGKILSAAAKRALAEAEERRATSAAAPAPASPREIQGRGGLEPVRFGDWEVKGLTSDF